MNHENQNDEGRVGVRSKVCNWFHSRHNTRITVSESIETPAALIQISGTFVVWFILSFIVLFVMFVWILYAIDFWLNLI